MAVFNNGSHYTPVTNRKKLANFAKLSFYEHNVLVENPDPQSMASLLLLQRGLHNRRNSNWLHKASRNVKRSFMKACFAKGEVRCYKCHIPLVQPTKDRQVGRNIASVDHIIPIKRNPAFARDPRNFRMSCQRCNSTRT
jgi:hypothetical protein